MKHPLIVILSLSSVLLVVSCSNSTSKGFFDASTDADSDTDGDTDGDGDSDTDGDGDSDTDGDVDTGVGKDDDVLIAQIVSPDDGESFLINETVDFRCRARYASGASAASPTYSWDIQPSSLNLFGDTVSTLVPEGEHQVTCTVVDSATNQKSSDKITIRVGAARVRIVRPDDGRRFPESSNGAGISEVIRFEATGRGSDNANGTYEWKIGTVSTLFGDTVETAVPLGTHKVSVTFTDPDNHTATDQITIEVMTRSAWQECLTQEEVCNGVDDDCDGRVDEGTIRCGIGECRQEAPMCINGQDAICLPDAPEPERCNGDDDDCDGLTDEQEGDINSLCHSADEVCFDGDCVNFENAGECTQCPCNDYCEDQVGLDLCCEFPGVGPGIICIDADADEDCPAF